MAKRKAASLEPCDNPSPGGSFGYASEAYRVNAGDHDLQWIQLPLVDDLDERQIDRDSVAMFRWEDDTQGWLLVAGSRLTPDRDHVTAPASSGVFIAVGESTHPMIRHAVSLISTLRPLLHDPELRDQFLPPICKLILCPGWYEEFRNAGSAELPLGDMFPPLPPGDICDICLGLPPGGIPEFQLPPKIDIPQFPPLELCLPVPEPMCDLARWLDQHPAIRQAIVWRDGTDHPYDSWSTAQKNELLAKFNTVRTGNNLGLPAEPPHTIHQFNNGDLFSTELAEADAWSYYVGYLAQTLYLEVCGRVPWTITAYNADELALILDSETMFHFVAARNTWAVLKRHGILFDHGAAMPGDPVRVFDFLISNGIIGGNALETVEKLIEWCRDNLVHFFNGNTPANHTDHWGYDGWPPVESIIGGTDYAPFGFNHYTAGCWGTTGFLRYVLRAANIPVVLEERCGHALPCFPTVDRHLSHGDDPYNQNTVNANAPGADIMIDGATFDAWFGPGADHCANVGRRSREFAP